MELPEKLDDISEDQMKKIKTVYVIGHIGTGSYATATLASLERMKESGVNIILVNDDAEMRKIHTENGFEGMDNLDKAIMELKPNLALLPPPPIPLIITPRQDTEYYSRDFERDMRKKNKKKRWESPNKYHR